MPRIHFNSYRGPALLARDLRRNQTISEKIVWDLLRKRQISGFKFLRQHPIIYKVDRKWVDFYIADFYCAELKLVIEVDGGIHGESAEYDNERDSKLNNKGLTVIRFKNEQVSDPDKIIAAIQSIIYKRTL